MRRFLAVRRPPLVIPNIRLILPKKVFAAAPLTAPVTAPETAVGGATAGAGPDILILI
jgi:hypothetical protein